MEGSSHPRSYSHHSRSHSRAQVFSGSATFSGSKKPPTFPTSGNNGGYFTTSYDDVFGGPPKFAALAPRAEDYSEIFGAFRSPASSRASAIPVLDLPSVSDIDSGASFLDYSEVFGGFEAVDFAVPYDELFRPFDAGDYSSDEAWTPVGTESLSDDSDPFAFSEKSPCFSDGNSQQSSDKQHFTVYYYKVDPGTGTSVPNMTHIAQLNAVPGYTCVVDEPTSPEQMVNERLFSTIGDRTILNVDSSPVFSQKHANQTMSHFLHDDDAVMSLDGNHISGRVCGISTFNANAKFAAVSDINLETESSHLSSPFRQASVPAEGQGDSCRLKPDPHGSKSCGLEVNDLPFFDMEVNASSSAAASAAAMKDAMEKAHTKLKAAKVIMDKKKENLQTSEDLGLKTDVSGGERVQIVHNKYTSKDERLTAASCPASVKIKSFGEDRLPRNASPVLPNDSSAEQHAGITEKLAVRKNGKKHSSFVETLFTKEAGEWKQATQYYEFINNDTANLDSLHPSNGDMKTAACKQQDSDDKHNSDSDDEFCVPENRRRLRATKVVSRQEYYEKMVKVAQEVHDTVVGGHAEAEHRLKDEPQGNLKQREGKLEKNDRKARPVEGEKPYEFIRAEGNGTGVKNTREREEFKLKEIHSHRHDPNENRVRRVFESMEDERRMGGSCDWESCEGRTQESILKEEYKQRVKEACDGQRKSKKTAGTPDQNKYNVNLGVKNNISKEDFDFSFDGKVLQIASESQEKGKMKELQQRKVEENWKKEVSDGVAHVQGQQKTCQSSQRHMNDKTSNEALEDIFKGERCSRTSKSEENVKTKGLLQIDECENRTEDGDEQGIQKSFKEAVELEDIEFPEQKEIKQMPDESEKRGCDGRESVEGRFVKSPMELHFEHELIQTGGLDETWQLPVDTSDNNEHEKHGNSLTTPVKSDMLDKDQKPDIFSVAEICSQDVKVSTGAKHIEKDFELDNVSFKVKEPKMEAHDSLEGSPQDDNGEISRATVAPEKESELEGFETTDMLIDERPTKYTFCQVPAADNQHKATVHPPDSLHTRDNDTTPNEVYTGMGQTMSREDKKGITSVSGPKRGKDFEIEQEEKRNVPGGDKVLYDDEGNARCVPPDGINGWIEQLRKKEVENSSMLEKKEAIQEKSKLYSESQRIERKVKITTEEKNKEKDRELDKEQLRKLEEEREREREKDRMAVEIAIREARERAYSVARDRAEKTALESATDEARQRAMAEARERLERACADARERSLADKTSDARLRAEFAPVERASAEARQRSIEKAMVERATLEARERMQRSVSEKYSSSSGREVTRQSSMPSIGERSEGDDVEPAERCRARLERHRRTVERVAKALAEKNMRDLLAQREQAERNRFAETLDADIKRWSNGKEGNLRALLSTLQYILGPDSGWQPIPLTEVITAAAVKKAYRKATLYVHPDKLQQRGASIQHKYTCEKVFDLLKEAWSRFNSEEI